MFQCLQEHLGEPNFGKDCLEQVEARAQRMQEDYRLDYGVSTQCKEDVPQFCAAEQVAGGCGHADCCLMWALCLPVSFAHEGCTGSG